MPLGFLEQVAGVCLLTLILVDIFVTVLYARAGTGLIAPHFERLITLEATALIRTALDARQFRWVRGSAALAQLEGSARLLLGTLADETHVPADRVVKSAAAGNGSAASHPPCRDCGTPAST